MTPPAPSLRPAAFLDRDGVINVDSGYLCSPDALAFTATAPRAIARLNRAGYLVVVVTNQSGVARGYFTMTDVERLHAEIRRRLRPYGARIDAFYVAPYHPDGIVAPYAIDHPDRKPGAGMLRRAFADWPIDRENSFLIGDKTSDLDAARAGGIRGVQVPADVCDLDAAICALLATGSGVADRSSPA